MLAAIVSLLFDRVLWALPPSLTAIDEQIGRVLVDQFTGGHVFALTLRRHFQIGQCALQHGQQPVNPIIGSAADSVQTASRAGFATGKSFNKQE